MQDKSVFQLSRGEWALVGITIIWGTTFIIIRNALEVTGPLFFVGLRFGSAAVALTLVSLPVLRGLTLHELFAGSIIGLSLLGGYALQTFGLQTITASKSAFITAFYVPTVPLLQWIFMQHPPSKMGWLGIGCALVGLIMLAGPDGVSPGFSAGELLTLLGAAGCNFIMGIPGADDIMLNYQSTSFHDAAYLRKLLGKRPAPEFEAWLESMGIHDDVGALLPPAGALRGALRFAPRLQIR